jgi:branched-chain amino acid transport system permease protein
MDLFLAQLINGIMMGSVYALIALGLALIFGILYIADFALGNKYMLSAYLLFFSLSILKTNFWVGMIIGMVGGAIISILTEVLVFKRLRDAPHINGFIAALGLLLIMESLALIFWGGDTKYIPPPYKASISIFGVVFPIQRLIIILATLLLITIVYYIIYKTTLGTTIRAVSQDPQRSALIGININFVLILVFGLAGILAGAAASLLGPIFFVYPTMGMVPILKAFVVIVLGGMGSIHGAVLGSYVVGVVESLGSGYISSDYGDLFAFGTMVIVLIFKPTGFFGREL